MDRTVMTSLGEVEVLEALRVRAQDLYPEVVARYVEALERRDRLPDLVVARLSDRLLLIDGRHRIAAWEAVGVPIVARVGWWIHDIGEALEMAIQANARHGEPRRLGDVARCIERALEVWGKESDREIARRVGCSPTSVGAQRARARQPSSEVEVSSLDTSKLPEGSAWRSPWTPESFQVVEPEARGEFVTVDQTATFSVEVEPLFVDEAPLPNVPWVIDADPAHAARVADWFQQAPPSPTVVYADNVQEVLAAADHLSTMRVEAEVPVTREVRRHRGQDPLERWYTDPALATVCWRWLLGLGLVKARKGVIQALEPAVGDGVWITSAAVAAAQMGQRLVIGWEACDLDPNAKGEGLVGTLIDDFLEVSWSRTFDLVITNPPNSKAFEFAKRALELVTPDGVVAFLMPLSWYAAQGRRVWLEEHPPYRVGVCPWRPSFGGPAAELQGTGNGTPTQVYALFVWVAGYQGETVLEIIPGSEVEDGEE